VALSTIQGKSEGMGFGRLDFGEDFYIKTIVVDYAGMQIVCWCWICLMGGDGITRISSPSKKVHFQEIAGLTYKKERKKKMLGNER
jgi:hypothetical protein